MSHKKLSPFIVKVSVLCYFPLYIIIYTTFSLFILCIMYTSVQTAEMIILNMN